jgi:hypothetical protein
MLARLRRGCRMLDDRETGARQGFCAIGFAFGKTHPFVISILIGPADRDRFFPGQRAEEPFEVGRLLTGGIDTDREVNRSMFF